METAEIRFEIVFVKLAEALAIDEAGDSNSACAADANPKELDEIAELRRLAFEISQPDLVSYTTA